MHTKVLIIFDINKRIVQRVYSKRVYESYEKKSGQANFSIKRKKKKRQGEKEEEVKGGRGRDKNAGNFASVCASTSLIVVPVAFNYSCKLSRVLYRHFFFFLSLIGP